MLRWTQATLAHRCGTSAVTLNMIENETVKPRAATMAAIRAALELGGVRFLDHQGVQLAPGPLSAATARQTPTVPAR